MSWEHIISIVGITLALGASFDYIIKIEIKKTFAEWLVNFTNKSKNFRFKGTSVLNAFFGKKLLSRGAVFRYAVISAVSMSIAYGFAYITSPPQLQNDMHIFPDGLNLLNGSLLAVCVVFAVAGDMLSYAQTRLFVRAVDEYKSGVVASGLALADIITSLSLFFISFSFSRIICYIIVLHATGFPALNSTHSISQELLRGFLLANNVASVNTNNDQVIDFVQLMANAKSELELKSISKIVNAKEHQSFRDPKNLRGVTYSSRIVCTSKDSEKFRHSLPYSRKVLDDIAQVINRYSFDKVTENDVNRYIYNYVITPHETQDGCGVHLLVIKKSISASDMLIVAGITNSYLASAERTMYDAYQILSFKLQPYIDFNPYKNIGNYFYSLSQLIDSTFLGIASPDYDKVALANEFLSDVSELNGDIKIPFTPMVASSLTSSLIFISYLLVLTLARFRQKLILLLRDALPVIDINRAVFTSLAVAFSLLILLMFVMSLIIGFAWQLMFI